MKKYLIISLLAFSFLKTNACYDYDADWGYYNLFMQETIGDPQYFPFLLSLSSVYYGVGYDSSINKNFANENIVEWQNYLKISYQQAYYLVFQAKKSDVDALIAGKTVKNDSLSFATQSFVNQYIQALKYISYSKYLEPYMSFKMDNNSNNYRWYYDSNNPPKSVGDLDYNKIIRVLTQSWKAETDNELKLRYGYQLVRFAHYYAKYSEAINFFNNYVQTLNYKPVIYYYALDQKAGAERGLGKITQAANDFFTVFNNIQNIKPAVYNSLRFCTGTKPDNDDYFSSYNFTEDFFQNLMKNAKTDDERNNIYLFLGYQAFNDPISSIEKIISATPDAIQARVLMARAINDLERSVLPSELSKCPRENNDRYSYYPWNFPDLSDCFPNIADRRLPLRETQNTENDYFTSVFQTSLRQAENPKVKHSDFWNTTTAYLYFLDKNYNSAKKYLAKVTEKDSLFAAQKLRLAMLIEICEQPKITPEFENTLFLKYKNIFETKPNDYYSDNYSGTEDFIIDILANRYFLQGEYAKSFLLQNSVTDLMANPDLTLIGYIETFFNKKDKSPMEKYLTEKNSAQNIAEIIGDIRGTAYLAQGDFENALKNFNKVGKNYKTCTSNWYADSLPPDAYDGYSNIANLIFGYNKMESFSSPDDQTMQAAYLSDFPFIKAKMNKKELTENLIQLQKIAQKNNELAARANYLLGNFFYNVTSTGYYRHVLRFDCTNGNGEKYRGDNNTAVNIYGNAYFKNYSNLHYYPDNLTLPNNYLQRAFSLTTDRELLAHIAFALSAVEQAEFYVQNNLLDYSWGDDNVLISDRKYFKELSRFSDTKFYQEVRTNCLYFEYYTNL